MGKQRERGRANRHRLRENAERQKSFVLQPRAGLTFPPALELHPDGLVDVLGEVQDALLLLLLFILGQSTGGPVKANHPRRHSPGMLLRDPVEGQGRGHSTGTITARRHSDHRAQTTPHRHLPHAAAATAATRHFIRHRQK